MNTRLARTQYDAVIVGAGPNGLAAAIVLATRGLSTLVVEAHAIPGGGARTLPLTLPGFTHDVCSAVHPLALSSPFFRDFELERYGVRWVDSPAELAHVLPDGRAVTLERSLDDMEAQLGRDGRAYKELFEPFVQSFDRLLPMILGPLRFPRSPFLMARFGLSAVRSLKNLVDSRFKEAPARALLAGIAAHAMLPLDAAATASFGLVLGTSAHAVGWPIPVGGSQAITDAMVAHYLNLGGELLLSNPVTRLSELPSARAYLLDVTPRQLLHMELEAFPAHYRKRLSRFRYGPGVYKMDWALSGPVPWKDPACARATTVHLSGTFEDVAHAEAVVHQGKLAREPFVLFTQPSLFDKTRAPEGKHVGWAYCHVPHGSLANASEAIEAHIERHAPGFRDLILARSVKNAVEVENYNNNYVGGDINGGQADLMQLFFRPVLRADPYATPAPNIFFCSSSTPPGGGVHGMCGYHAARSVLKKVFGRKLAEDHEQSLSTHAALFSERASSPQA